MSTFPLPVKSAQGMSSPSYNDILNYLTTQFQSIYGSDAVLTPDSQDGQWLAVQALVYFDLIQVMVAEFNSRSPVFAQGAGLDSVVKINGLQRLIPSNSTAVVTIVGVAGTQITNGVVQDTSGNLWNLPGLVVIPNTGSINVTVTSQVVGAISASTNTITTIFTPTLGWQSVTNPAAAVPGAPVETDAQLRQRQSISTGQPAQTPIQAIIAAVANLPTVTRIQGYENSTNATDSNNIPSHSICIVVQGGIAASIAQAIEAKKSPGTGTFGSTTVVVNDPGGLPVPIKFSALAFTPIFVSVTIHPLNNFSAATAQTVATNLLNFLNNLPIGQAVLYDWLVAVVAMIDQPAGVTFSITTLTSGLAATPVGTADIPIAFDHAASSIAANIIVTVA